MSTAPSSHAASTNQQPSFGLPVVGVVVAIMLIAVGLAIAGRRDEKLPSAYGRRRGSEAGRSVNGTAVLAEMFRKSGHRITTRTRFSPKMEDYDVVVWIPDDFLPPTKERREYLEDWLKNKSGRTVIYVGRDYDAAVDYWERVMPETPAPLADEALHRQAEARAAWEAARSKMPTHEYARWFTASRDEPPRTIDQLAGAWAEGIDAQQANIRIEGRLLLPSEAEVTGKDDPHPPTTIEPLLTSGKDTLIFRLRDKPWKLNANLMDGEADAPSVDDGEGTAGQADDAQVIVLVNGSLVLNYPLVNHENRKLAQRLIDACGKNKKVVFIESGTKGPEILTKEPTGGFPSPLELLKVWPLNAILLHLTALGIIVCLAKAPIFGRPRELPADSPADFGKHVAALGKLLVRTKDRNYAQARIAQYRQFAERKSGRSHRNAR